MAAALVDVQGLTKIYGGSWSPLGLVQRASDAALSLVGSTPARSLRAVDELSFSVDEGGIVGFLGPNGAGKTTTLKAVVGLLRPTAGTVRVFGHDPWTDHATAFARLGALIDKPAFPDYLTGRTCLRIVADLHGPDARSRVGRLLEESGVGAAADRPVRTYSTGMKQRLGLAAALVPDPVLLVLDEPTRGLDPKGQAEVRELLRRLVASGRTTVLFSSHLLHEVEVLCSRVVIIDRGRQIHAGPVADLPTDAGDVTVRCVVGDGPAARTALAGSSAVRKVEVEGEGSSRVLLVSVASGGVPEVARILVGAGVAVEELTRVRRSLEDFFLSVTTGGEA